MRALFKTKAHEGVNDMSLIPMVIEQTNRGERSFDIYSPPTERPYRFSGRRN